MWACVTRIPINSLGYLRDFGVSFYGIHAVFRHSVHVALARRPAKHAEELVMNYVENDRKFQCTKRWHLLASSNPCVTKHHARSGVIRRLSASFDRSEFPHRELLEPS